MLIYGHLFYIRMGKFIWLELFSDPNEAAIDLVLHENRNPQNA